MNFPGAVNSINGMYLENNAAKSRGWGGYVFKAQTEQQVATGAFTLTFVKRNGDQYVYAYSGTSWSYTGYIANDNGDLGDGSPVAATTLEYDDALLAAELGDGWYTGSQIAFEAERHGNGEW